MESYNHMLAPKEDDKRAFVRFTSGQGTEDEFLSNLVQEEESEIPSQFSILRNKLEYNEKTGESIINEESAIDQSIIQ